MLSKLLRWITRGREPAPRGVDPLALQVTRRQRRVAKRLSNVTGRTPEELLGERRRARLLDELHSHR